MQTETSGAVALLQHVAKHHQFEIVQVEDPAVEGQSIPVAVVPEGKKLQDLTPFLEALRPRPTRRKGIAAIKSRQAFIDHVNDFKDNQSAVFADPNREAPKLLAVYDYNERGGIEDALPRFGQHRAVYQCELSEQWQAWMEQNETPLNQAEFAAFLEDHIEDVMLVDGPHINELVQLLEAKVGGPSAMLKLSRGLQVTATTRVGNAVTLATGEVQVNFAEHHADEKGSPITTPNLFFLNIPVFDRGEAYQVALRLRYRLAQGIIQWSYSLYRTDKIFDDAFKGIVDAVAKECDVKVYLGTPEV